MVIQPAGQPPLLVLRAAQQLGGHRRRQCQCDHTGYRHGASQGKGELTKQRTGQPALQSDRDVHSDQRQCHGYYRGEQLARTKHRGFARAASLAQVALDVLDHDDGIVDHQPHR